MSYVYFGCRFVYSLLAKYSRFKEDKRYAILVAYLLNLSQDLIDLAIEIHDRQIMILQSKGRKTQEEMQKQNGKSVNEKVIHFADIRSALIKAKEEGLDPFTIIKKVMPWDDIVASIGVTIEFGNYSTLRN